MVLRKRYGGLSVITLLLMVAITLAPCVVSATSNSPTTLVIALTGDIPSIDVDMLSGPLPHSVARLLYGDGIERKLFTDPETGLTYATVEKRPGLIESWERREEDGNVVYTCHIRKGLRFDSGRELTAKDYKYKISRVWALSDWDVYIGGATTGDCINILDDYTFEVIFDQPNAITDEWICDMLKFVYDSQELKKQCTDADPWGHNYMRTHELGIGAYDIDYTTPGVETVLVKNEDYSAPDYMQGYFDRIVFKIIPSLSHQMLLLKNGEIDFAPGLPAKEILDLSDEPSIRVLSFDSMMLFRLTFNIQEEPFGNVKVRQALAYAVPYKSIVDAVYLDKAQMPSGLLTEGTPGATDKYWVYEYDLDKAKELLAEAGYSDGFDMELHFDLAEPMHESAAVLIQNSFAKIGVNVNLVKENPAAFHEKLYMKEAPPATLYAGLSWIISGGYSLDMVFASWGYQNWGHYNSAELDNLLEKTWKITDSEIRLPMYDRAQEIIDTELPAIALCQPDYLVALREDIGGFVKWWDEYPRYHRLYRIEK